MRRNGGQAAGRGTSIVLSGKRTGPELPEPNVTFWGGYSEAGLGGKKLRWQIQVDESRSSKRPSSGPMRRQAWLHAAGTARRSRGPRHLQRLLEELTGKERRSHGECRAGG